MRITITTLALAGLLATAVSGADANAGKTVYAKSCKACHGPDGAGNPAIAKMMKVTMKDLKSPEIQAMSDDAIKAVVSDGKGKMKPVASVTGASVDNVVAFIRTLKQ